MSSVTHPASRSKASSPRQPLPPVEATGQLTTGINTGLADILNDAAVLTIVSPTGAGLYWLGAILDQGRVVGLTLRKFQSGELYRVTFDGQSWECDCPDCCYRQRDCKHLIALHQVLTAAAGDGLPRPPAIAGEAA